MAQDNEPKAKSLPQWQKIYPDTIKADLKLEKSISIEDCKRTARGLFGPESTILQCRIGSKQVVFYSSKQAYAAGIRDEQMIISN